MNETVIDLTKPFDRVLAIALSLPRDDDRLVNDGAIKQAVRRLYEAAHGRFVQTQIGPIPIAPPVEASLQATPLLVNSARELIVLCEAKSKPAAGAPSHADRTETESKTFLDLCSGSALFEFMSGRLGAPECWPNQKYDAICSNGTTPEESPASSRWKKVRRQKLSVVTTQAQPKLPSSSS